MKQHTGGITKFLKMGNLEKILKVELLLLEFLGTENPKEIVIFLTFSLHFCKNCNLFRISSTLLQKCGENL